MINFLNNFYIFLIKITKRNLYLFDQMSKGMRYSGGYYEAWYPEKVAKIIEKKSFDNLNRDHKDSRVLVPKLFLDRFFLERDYLSLKNFCNKKVLLKK